MSKAVKTSAQVGAVYRGYRPPSREQWDNALRKRLGKIYKPIQQAWGGGHLAALRLSCRL
jgi:hypothetical protein